MADPYRTGLDDVDGVALAAVAEDGILTLAVEDGDADDLLVVDDPAALAELAMVVAVALEQRAVAIAAGHPVNRGLACGTDVSTRTAGAARHLGYALEALHRI